MNDSIRIALLVIPLMLCAVAPLTALEPSPAPPPPDPSLVFPYAYTPEVLNHDYLKFRAEGLSLHEASKWAVSYVRKWRAKKFSAPKEELAYFDHQRQLLHYLKKESVPADAPNHVRLGLVGDIMWIRTQWTRFLAAETLSYLEGFDAVLGNLETPVAHSFSIPHYQPDCMAFNSDPALVRSFRNAKGSNVLTAVATANNHCLDCGDKGALETMAFLDEERILHSGMAPRPGQKRFVTFVRNGIKFGFYAATWGVNDPDKLKATKVVVNWVPGLAPEVDQDVDATDISQVLKDMKGEGCDFKIISLHWGHEFEYYPTPNTMRFGRKVIAAGADLVLGSHPHVQQPPEVCFLNGYEKRYQTDPEAASLPALKGATGCILSTADQRPRKGLILYSMGNFVTLMFPTMDRVGLIDDIQVFKDRSTGATDWVNLHSQFAFNKVPEIIQFIGENARKLFLVDRPPYPLAELDRKDCGPEGNQTPIDFLKHHLGVE